MHRFRSSWWGFLVAVVGAVLLTAPASAQRRHEGPPFMWPSSLPAEQLRVGPEKVQWMGQLNLARAIGARALAGLRNTPMTESAIVDDEVLQAARDNYMLLRAATQGMTVFMGKQKYPDPIMDLALKRVTTAFHLAGPPVDKYTWGISRPEYLTEAISDLDQSIRLVDQALVLIP